VLASEIRLSGLFNKIPVSAQHQLGDSVSIQLIAHAIRLIEA
jgi:hypothetical protein